MYFGAVSFSEAPWSSQGPVPYAYVNVNGSRVNTNTGTVSFIGNANVAATGSQANFTIGNVVLRVNQRVDVTGVVTALSSGTVAITADANILPTGSQVNVDTGNPTFAFKYNVTRNTNFNWKCGHFASWIQS
jgi:hypothetical protein